MKEDDDLVEVEIDGEKSLVPKSLAEKLGLTIVKPAEKVKKDYSFYYQIGLLLTALIILILLWCLAMTLGGNPAEGNLINNLTEPEGNHVSPTLGSCIYCIFFRLLKQKQKEQKNEKK